MSYARFMLINLSESHSLWGPAKPGWCVCFTHCNLAHGWHALDDIYMSKDVSVAQKFEPVPSPISCKLIAGIAFGYPAATSVQLSPRPATPHLPVFVQAIEWRECCLSCTFFIENSSCINHRRLWGRGCWGWWCQGLVGQVPGAFGLSPGMFNHSN